MGYLLVALLAVGVAACGDDDDGAADAGDDRMAGTEPPTTTTEVPGDPLADLDVALVGEIPADWSVDADGTTLVFAEPPAGDGRGVGLAVTSQTPEKLTAGWRTTPGLELDEPVGGGVIDADGQIVHLRWEGAGEPPTIVVVQVVEGNILTFAGLAPEAGEEVEVGLVAVDDLTLVVWIEAPVGELDAFRADVAWVAALALA